MRACFYFFHIFEIISARNIQGEPGMLAEDNAPVGAYTSVALQCTKCGMIKQDRLDGHHASTIMKERMPR